jgi:hypothetical protein
MSDVTADDILNGAARPHDCRRGIGDFRYAPGKPRGVGGTGWRGPQRHRDGSQHDPGVGNRGTWSRLPWHGLRLGVRCSRNGYTVCDVLWQPKRRGPGQIGPRCFRQGRQSGSQQHGRHVSGNRVLVRIAKDGGDPGVTVNSLYQALCAGSDDQALAAAYSSLPWPNPVCA